MIAWYWIPTAWVAVAVIASLVALVVEEGWNALLVLLALPFAPVVLAFGWALRRLRLFPYASGRYRSELWMERHPRAEYTLSGAQTGRCLILWARRKKNEEEA